MPSWCAYEIYINSSTGAAQVVCAGTDADDGHTPIDNGAVEAADEGFEILQ